MGFNDILKKIVGNKATRDMKEISPEVTRIKAVYEEIKNLSNDELRARTELLKATIQEAIASENARIEELKASIEETELHLREKIYNEIDKLEKEITLLRKAEEDLQYRGLAYSSGAEEEEI